ncbi:ribokinase [Saccharopolyspora montiporae]|uniref:ribokinase n=1 Tax=Saccharopolyspora montiporae TaxID=2781240 RepID=UPI00351C5C2A
MTTTVTVFGSCNMDLVAYVPTAPGRGETVLGREFRTAPGGKGANQAVAAAKAGARTRMIGAVGDDEFGDRITRNLRESTVDVAGMRVVPGASGTAHIVVDDAGANSIVVVPGANAALDDLADGDDRVLDESDCLLLQLEIPLPGVAAAARAARRRGARVVLTPAPAAELPAELLADVDLLVPNEHEAAVLTGSAEPREALRGLLELVGEAVITRGSAGSVYGNRDGDVVEVPAFPVPAVDTTAAGDTFAGVLATELGAGSPVERAMRRAAAASALSVQRNGATAAMPERAEVDRFLSER